MNKEIKSIAAGSAVFILAAALRKYIPLHNILFYVFLCFLFTVSSIGCYVYLSRKEQLPKDRMAAKGLFTDRSVGILLSVLLLLWMILAYIFELNEPAPLDEKTLIRRTFPFPLWIILMTAGTAFILFLFGRSKKDGTVANSPGHRKVRHYVREIISFLMAAAVSVQYYAPNIFRDVQGGTYHSHAYTNSIINICWMIPYSHNLQSIYGHYAIIFMPFVKLLHKLCGIDYLTGIFIISALLQGISVLLFACILAHFAKCGRDENPSVKNELLFYLGLFSIGEHCFMMMQGGVYLQLMPHRAIFPMLVTYAALKEQQTGHKHPITAVILLSLSFTWASEIGIVTMAAYTLYRWYEDYTKQSSGKLITVTILADLIKKALLYIAVPLVLSYLTVLAYNLAAGSGLSFKEFLFPLISDRDYISNIELPLPGILHAWIPSSILLLGFTVHALMNRSKSNAMHFFLGLLGLGLMLYYLNRPVAGAMVILVLLVPILFTILLNGLENLTAGQVFWQSPFGYTLQAALVFILFMMSFDSIWSMPGAYAASRSSIWQRQDLLDFAGEIAVQVPPDAYAFGEGVPELMSLVDRDTHLHTTEWSLNSMPLDTMAYARKEMEGRPWFFCNMFSLYYMQENYPGLTDEYDLHDLFEYNGAEFGLFYHK